MFVTFPHMGNIWVPVSAIGRKLGVNIIVPPLNSRRTLSLGTRYSPETVCLPFKLTLGNMIESLEMGADTILTMGQYGPCRFGYYNKLQEVILREQGYQFQMIRESFGILNMIKYVSNKSLVQIVPALHFGLVKLRAIEELERLARHIRPREQEKGSVTGVFNEAVKAIDQASGFCSVGQAKNSFRRRLENLPVLTAARTIKIGITGEFYVVIDAFANMDLDVELGKLGVEVVRPHTVQAWLSLNLFARAFRQREKDRCHRAAQPYLYHHVGGDGQQSVGEKVLHARDWDGIIHLEPFGCLPEITARNIMPITREKTPVLNLIYDEYTGKAGVVSRLEAFVDMIKQKRWAGVAACA